MGRFETLFRKLDPDFVIGWHVIGFDLNFLLKRALALKIPLRLGRDGGPLEVYEKGQKQKSWVAKIIGRQVLDGPPMLRTLFYKFENFKLETVAQELLGEGKTISESGLSKVEEIERQFREDKLALAHYNMMDSLLVSRIFSKN